MAARLSRPLRGLNMPSSIIRYGLAALCMLLVIVTILENDASHIRTHLLQHAGMMEDATAAKNHASFGNKNATKQTSAEASSHTQTNDLITSGADGAKPRFMMNCSADHGHLTIIKDRYQLDNKFQYAKRYVRFHRKEGLERRRMTKLSQPFLPSSLETVDLGEPLSSGAACDKPLEIDVPASPFPQTANASDFIFGVSTTYERFSNPKTTPIHEWVYWLTDSHGKPNGGKLVLMLLGASDDQLQEVANKLGDIGIDADVYHSHSSEGMAVRYFNLVPTLFMHPASARKKWFATCDDDTYFASMHALISRMQTFDPTTDLYIGTLSEDVGAVERHGSQAFGGAGVFLSRTMAEKITNLHGHCTSEAKVVESDSGWGPQGDSLLRNCIYQNTEVRLTTMRELWQLDIMGDPSGFYEWGIKPFSLHHYRGGGWHSAKPREYTRIAHACGEDCTLMRFQTTDDFIISGYSIAHYPYGVSFDTNQMEATLFAAPQNRGWNLDFVFGPQRPSLTKTGRKIAWELQSSEEQSDGSVIQTYIRRKDDERWVNEDRSPMSNIDGIFELVWIPS